MGTTQYSIKPGSRRLVAVWQGVSMGTFYVGGAEAGKYHETAQCRALTTTRAFTVNLYDHDGVVRRPFMREQDVLDGATRPMIDEGKRVRPCATCIGKTPEIVHLETDKAIPCEGSDEWVQMEGAAAATNPEVYRPQQVSCFKCPIRVECFGKAMREKPKYGIWGGTTPAQREAWGDRADEIAIRSIRNGAKVKPYGETGRSPEAYQPTLEGIG